MNGDNDPDISAAVAAYNDPKRSMAERVGLRGYRPPSDQSPNQSSSQMSKEEADQYLAERRAKQTVTPSANMSKDEADQYLKQYRTQRATPASFNERFAATIPPTQPSGQAPVAQPEQYPLGVGLSTLFHGLPPGLQQLIREHPYMSGAATAAAIPIASALLPEEALGAGAAFALKNIGAPLARWGLGFAGLDWLTGHNLTSKLTELLTSGLEGGGGAAP